MGHDFGSRVALARYDPHHGGRVWWLFVPIYTNTLAWLLRECELSFLRNPEAHAPIPAHVDGGRSVQWLPGYVIPLGSFLVCPRLGGYPMGLSVAPYRGGRAWSNNNCVFASPYLQDSPSRSRVLDVLCQIRFLQEAASVGWLR